MAALSDVSFDLPSSGLVFVLGRSGSGKSTLLNILGGLDRASGGRVTVDGLDLGALSASSLNRYRRGRVGFCFQKSNLILSSSVEDNVRMGGESSKNDKDRVSEILSELDLQGLEKRVASELSGGQQQRVALARALYKDPSVVLCDEPTGSLDSKTSAIIFSALKRISEGRLVVVVTHDEASAEKYGDRIMTLSDGKISSDAIRKEAGEKKMSEKAEALRTPFPIRARLCLQALRKMPVRLAFSIILISLSFGLLGPVLDGALRDESAMLSDSIASSGDPSISLTKSVSGSSGRESSSLHRRLFGGEADSLRKEYGTSGVSVYSASSSILGSKATFIYSAHSVSAPKKDSLDGYLMGDCPGFASIDGPKLGSAGLFLSSGRLPSSGEECAISLMEYGCFAKYGFLDAGGASFLPEEISSEADFLALSPTISAAASGGKAALRVVGIVDTRFDRGAYGEAIDLSTSSGAAGAARLGETLGYGLHRCLFVSDSFADEYFPDSDSIPLWFTEGVSFSDGDYSEAYDCLFDDSSLSVPLGRGGTPGIYLPLGAFAHSIAGSSIALGADYLFDYSKCLDYSVPFSSIPSSESYSSPSRLFMGPSGNGASNLSLAACGGFVRRNGLPSGDGLLSLRALAQSEYDAARESGRISSSPDFSDGSKESDEILKSFYAAYLASEYFHPDSGRTAGGYLANGFGTLSGQDVTAGFASSLLSAISEDSTVSLAYSGGKLEGRLLGLSLRGGLSDPSPSLSEGLFSEAASVLGDSGTIAFVYFPSIDGAKRKEALKGAYVDGSLYFAHNGLISSYEYMGKSFGSSLRTAFSAVSIAAFVFSVALLFTMLSSSSRSREREMVIRRCNGEGRGAVYVDLSMESLSVGILAYLLSIAVSLTLVPVVNTLLSSAAGVALSYVSYSLSASAICLASIALTCLLSSVFPSLGLSKKSLSAMLGRE